MWVSLKIDGIRTLTFNIGREFWRREATYSLCLRKVDFNKADSVTRGIQS
jgi:hypothetical protein